MKNSNYPVAAINSGCELFLRFITFAAIDTSVSIMKGLSYKYPKHVFEALCFIKHGGYK